eukprot:scaffold417257_cov20-Prasinocladus_malaysianus.AAC.1
MNYIELFPFNYYQVHAIIGPIRFIAFHPCKSILALVILCCKPTHNGRNTGTCTTQGFQVRSRAISIHYYEYGNDADNRNDSNQAR